MHCLLGMVVAVLVESGIASGSSQHLLGASKRAQNTDPAHIEVVLDKYADLQPRPAVLAQGVSHWQPPPSVLAGDLALYTR
jgi:hypothetical protein